MLPRTDIRVSFISAPKQTPRQFVDKLHAAAAVRNIFAQAFNPSWVVSERHLVSAYLLAKQAFAEKENTGKTMETETLLKAAATTQIQEAIERAGITSAEKFLLLTDANPEQLVALLAEIGAVQSPAAYSPDGKLIAKTLGFTKQQLANYSLEDLVLEAVAVSGTGND